MHSITLLQLNDLHGYLRPHGEIFSFLQLVVVSGGGLARIATVFRQVRAETSDAVAADNGDTFHGTYAAVSLGEGIDTSTAVGRMTFGILGSIAQAERQIVLAGLDKHGWHVTKTAEALGLADHSTLLKIMRRHGLSKGPYRDS